MAFLTFVGLFLVLQSLAHGQPVESTPSVGVATGGVEGAEAGAAPTEDQPADTLGGAIAAGINGRVPGINVRAPGISGQIYGIDGSGFFGGLNRATSGLAGGITTGLGGLSGGVGQMAGGLVGGTLGLLGQPLAANLAIGRNTPLYGSTLDLAGPTSLAALRGLLAASANGVVNTVDDATNGITSLGNQLLLSNGRGIDSLLGNVGIQTRLGEDLANAGAQLATQGRDGGIYVMQNAVDGLLGLPVPVSSEVAGTAPAAAVA